MAYDSSNAVFENNDRLRIYPHFCSNFAYILVKTFYDFGGMRVAQAESEIYPPPEVGALRRSIAKRSLNALSYKSTPSTSPHPLHSDY